MCCCAIYIYIHRSPGLSRVQPGLLFNSARPGLLGSVAHVAGFGRVAFDIFAATSGRVGFGFGGPHTSGWVQFGEICGFGGSDRVPSVGNFDGPCRARLRCSSVFCVPGGFWWCVGFGCGQGCRLPGCAGFALRRRRSAYCTGLAGFALVSAPGLRV